LENGEFYLLVVVDEISDVAARTIQFFNQKLNKLRIDIVEVSKFVAGQRRIFVPTHVNREETKESRSPRPGKITFEELLSLCGDKEAQFIRSFHEKWTSYSDTSISMGTKGFSAWHKDTAILYVLTSRIQIAPPIKKRYPHLFDPLMEILQSHFSSTTKTSGLYNSPDLTNDHIRTFVEKVLVFLDGSLGKA